METNLSVLEPLLDDGTNVDCDDLKRKEEELMKMFEKVKVSDVQCVFTAYSLKLINWTNKLEC